MLLTHSFVAAVSPGWYKYIFYVIEGGYYDHREEFIREFRWNLESLGRSLGDRGVVVAPFQSDARATSDEITFKEWRSDELAEIQRTPSLLVLTKDLADFSPRSDPWLLMHFDEGRYSDRSGYVKLKEAFAAIAEAVVGPDAEPEQLYKVARNLVMTRRTHGRILMQSLESGA